MATVTIGMRYRSCTGAFEQLCRDQEPFGKDIDTTLLQALHHQLGRFQIWAGDAGATETGRASLEHQLWDSEDLYQAVVDLVDDLYNQLLKFIQFSSGRRSPLATEGSDSTSSINSPASNVEDHKLRTDQLLGAIDEIIGLLFQLSVQIRDEVLNASKSRRTSFSTLQAKDEDLRLVVGNFPNASASLCNRLATAVTASLAALNKKTILDTADEPISDASSEISSNLSEYCPTDLVTFGNANQVSRDEWGSPNFVCSFCSLRVKFKSERHWRSHVSRDILPYICTFVDCTQGSKVFGTRQDWFNHEARVHRKRWLCNSCQENYLSRADFVNHLKLRHSELSAPLQLEALVEMCERPMDREGLAKCPICLKEDQLIRTHLPSHMSTLAFAALRRDQDVLGWEGQGREHGIADRDSSMSSESSTASDTSTDRVGKSKDSRSIKPKPKIIFKSRPIGDSTQHKPSDRLNDFSDALAASRDTQLADRESIVRSLRRTLEYDTGNYERNLLNYVADLQISQDALENRIRMLEANQDRDGRRAMSMKMLRLLDFDYDIPINDTKSCANGYYTMDEAAKGRASWVVQSEMVRQWLGSAWSACLLVHGNSDASLAASPLSLLCAKAIGVFSARHSVFVLRYFCGLHTRISKPRDNAIGMMNSLLGQLILQSERLLLDLDLACFSPEDLRGAKEDHLPSLLAMFRKCILRIPYSFTIYCVIDGISFYETSQRRNSALDVLHQLRRIITKAKGVVFKLLVTAPGRTRSIHRLFERDEIVNIPEYVPNDAVQGFLDDKLSGLAEISPRRQDSRPRKSRDEELQASREWWNQNGSRESLVSAEA